MVKWTAAAVVVLVVGVGLYLFQPWRLLTSSTIDEAAPVSEVQASSTPTERQTDAPTGTPAGSPTGEPTTSSDRVLANGSFEDAEHATAGRVRILELADGRRFVRIEDLDSSDGPDLHVWLSDQPSGGDWSSYDDGSYVKLGKLKATHGNQNYAIPKSADIAAMTSVVIWCDRFNVAFGTAAVALS